MRESNIYVDFLIGDLEAYIYRQKKEINNLLKENVDLSVEQSILIFEKLAQSLKKTSDLIRFLNQVEDVETLRNVCIVSTESLAWVLFTLPTLEMNLPLFVENLKIKDSHIMDIIGENLISLEEMIENPKKLKFMHKEIFEGVKEASLSLGYINKIIQKGAIEH